MGPKYEFTDETMNYESYTLHRIRRIEDGKLGGWIESEANLSQEGSCWVDDNAWVYDEARVYGNAKIYGEAKVFGEAKVYGNAQVYDNAEVNWNAQVKDNAQIYGNADVSWYSKVFDNARVYDNTWIGDKAKVYGDAKVYGKADVRNDAQVYGNAEVYDNALVCGNAKVYGNAKVHDNTQVCDNAEVYGNALVCDDTIVDGHTRVSDKTQIYDDTKVDYNEVKSKFVKYVLEKYKEYGNSYKILMDMYNDGIIVNEDDCGYDISPEYSEESIYDFVFENDIHTPGLYYYEDAEGFCFKMDSRLSNIYKEQEERLSDDGDGDELRKFYTKVPNPDEADCQDLVYVSPVHSHYGCQIDPLTDNIYEYLPLKDVLTTLKKCFKLSDEEIEKMFKEIN